MTAPTLCVIQARLHSTRLPNKMLLELAGETLIARAWRMACATFDPSCVVVAIPAGDEAGPLGDELRRIGATIFAFDGHACDVLGRFWACAHTYRWHPDTVIHRWTPDDIAKNTNDVRAVAAGRRLPEVLGGEAFTLAQLDAAHEKHNPDRYEGTQREHITWALFPVNAPKPPADGVIREINTLADYGEAQAAHETRR